jgi:ribonuclease-3 family protein
MVKDLLRLPPPTTVGIYAKLGQVELVIMAKAKTERAAKGAIAKIERKIYSRLKDYIFGFDDDTLEGAAAAGLIAGGRPPISEMLGRLAPVTIAYLGDAVWELEARERALWPPNKLDTLSTQVQDICCAEGQYAVLERIVADFGLTEGELDWLRRGRNASARGPRRLEPKVSRASTSLETLVGVLHLTDRARLAELFDFVWADKARPGSNLADPQASPQVDTAHG